MKQGTKWSWAYRGGGIRSSSSLCVCGCVCVCVCEWVCACVCRYARLRANWRKRERLCASAQAIDSICVNEYSAPGIT